MGVDLTILIDVTATPKINIKQWAKAILTLFPSDRNVDECVYWLQCVPSLEDDYHSKIQVKDKILVTLFPDRIKDYKGKQFIFSFSSALVVLRKVGVSIFLS